MLQQHRPAGLYRMLWAGAFLGLLLHLAGIAWDVYLHANDESLAAREGVLTLSNPGHALIFAGVGLISACVLGVAFTWLLERKPGGAGRGGALLRASAIPVVGVAAAGSIWLASLAQGDSHDEHEAVASQQHETPADDAEDPAVATATASP